MGVHLDLTVTIADETDSLRVERRDGEHTDGRVAFLQMHGAGGMVYATLEELEEFAEALREFVAHQRAADVPADGGEEQAF